MNYFINQTKLSLMKNVMKKNGVLFALLFGFVLASGIVIAQSVRSSNQTEPVTKEKMAQKKAAAEKQAKLRLQTLKAKKQTLNPKAAAKAKEIKPLSNDLVNQNSNAKKKRTSERVTYEERKVRFEAAKAKGATIVTEKRTLQVPPRYSLTKTTFKHE